MVNSGERNSVARGTSETGNDVIDWLTTILFWLHADILYLASTIEKLLEVIEFACAAEIRVFRSQKVIRCK